VERLLPNVLWEAKVQHHRQADDLWRGLEVLERATLGHGRRLGSRLIDDQSQNKTVAARAMAERKTFGHLS
jgi:hypothetical protein